jgi:23S rRNA (guanine745-N1)-methyltransferase
VPALDDVLPLLRCPHCEADLQREAMAVRCAQGHSFDLARQGYLSLFAGAGSAHTGDTAEMVAARERFLAAGHFEPLAHALAEMAGAVAERAGAAAGQPPGARLVVELGAGPGWYLARVLDRVPDALGLALDVSKPALRRAARAHPRLAAVGADVWGPLPLRDRVATVVIAVFAPRSSPEIDRILAPGGQALVVTPTAAHLQELREPLGLLGIGEHKPEGRELTWTLTLDRAAARDAAAMGPSAFHISPAELDRRVEALPETTTVTAAVALVTTRVRGSSAGRSSPTSTTPRSGAGGSSSPPASASR